MAMEFINQTMAAELEKYGPGSPEHIENRH
jgi:hypothetical protein